MFAAASIWVAPRDLNPLIRTFWSPEIQVSCSVAARGRPAVDSTVSSSPRGS